MVKLLSRGKRTVREVALELNINYHTAKNKMKRGYPDKADMSPGKESKKPIACQAKPCAVRVS